MNTLIIRLVGWLLKRNLTLEQRNKIVVHILSSLQASPLTDIIMKTDDGLIVNGKFLEVEQAIVLREAAELALRNRALNLIREQVKYEAFVGAAIKSAQPYDLLFYRAALWWEQQEENYLVLLAQRQDQPEV